MTEPADYLGRHISELAEAFQMSNPEHTLSKSDGGETQYASVSESGGFEAVLDAEKRVTALIFDAASNSFLPVEISEAWSQAEVLKRFGTPESFSAGIEDPILGRYGPWYRWCFKDHYLHIEFVTGGTHIKKVTLMTTDTAP